LYVYTKSKFSFLGVSLACSEAELIDNPVERAASGHAFNNRILSDVLNICIVWPIAPFIGFESGCLIALELRSLLYVIIESSMREE